MDNLLVTMNFAEWLKTTRKEQGISLVRLVDKIGNLCSDAYLSKLENAKYQSKKGNPMRPDKEIVIALAQALNGDVDYVLTLAGYAPTKPNYPIKGFDDTLDESDIQKIEEYIAFLKSQKK